MAIMVTVILVTKINNIVYVDFAVGAPFDGDGVVYIYYGQNVNGSIVNTTIQQVQDIEYLVNILKLYIHVHTLYSL